MRRRNRSIWNWNIIKIFTISYMFYLTIPIFMLMICSFGENWTNILFPAGLTGLWFLKVYNDPRFRRAFVASLKFVMAACAINITLRLPLAYAVYSSHLKGVRPASRIVFLLPIAVPELVLAFSFVLVFSSDNLPWLGSLGLLISAHVVLTLPYFFLTLIADMQHLSLRATER